MQHGLDISAINLGQGLSKELPGIKREILGVFAPGWGVSHARLNNVRTLRHKQTVNYVKWIHNWFQHDMKNLSELYAMLPSPPPWISGEK
jgi:hypothetical protein